MRAQIKDEAMLARLNDLSALVRREVDASRGAVAEDAFKTSSYQGRAPAAMGYRQGEVLRPRNPWRDKCRRELPRPVPKARRGELPLWQFQKSEMQRWGVSKCTVYGWIKQGMYPGLKLRTASRRFVFVRVPKGELVPLNIPRPGEISLKEFVALECARRQTHPTAIYMRLDRKRYPGLRFRRVTKRLVFVVNPEVAK